MFATYLAGNNTANVFLTPAEQRVFCEIDGENIFPVPNKWGEKGATTIELVKAYCTILAEARYPIGLVFQVPVRAGRPIVNGDRSNSV
jgi:hypothetical protein